MLVLLHHVSLLMGSSRNTLTIAQGHCGFFCKKLSPFVPARKTLNIPFRKRALDLLYSICNDTNVEEVVHHLLLYLKGADFAKKWSVL